MHTHTQRFTAIFTPPEDIDAPGMPVRPRRFVAKLSYHGQPFASVPVEVSMVEADNASSFDAISSDALGLVGLPAAVMVPCMTIPWQIAQKLHACTAVLAAPKTNDRAHDLVDLQLLEARLADAPLEQTRLACVAVFAGRAQQPWPPMIQPLPHWRAFSVRRGAPARCVASSTAGCRSRQGGAPELPPPKLPPRIDQGVYVAK